MHTRLIMYWPKRVQNVFELCLAVACNSISCCVYIYRLNKVGYCAGRNGFGLTVFEPVSGRCLQ